MKKETGNSFKTYGIQKNKSLKIDIEMGDNENDFISRYS